MAKEYAAWLNLVKSFNKLNEGRFACATFSNEGGIFSFINLNGYIIQGNSFRSRIFESHIFKLDVSINLDILTNRLIN